MDALLLATLLVPLITVPFLLLNRRLESSQEMMIDLSRVTSPSEFVRTLMSIRYVMANFKLSTRLNQMVNGLLSFHTRFFNEGQLEVLSLMQKDKSSIDYFLLHLKQLKRFLFVKYQEAIHRYQSFNLRNPTSAEFVISFCYFLRENETESTSLPDLDTLLIDLRLGFFREYEVYCLR